MVGFLPAQLNSFAPSASVIMKFYCNLFGIELKILLFSFSDGKVCC